MSVVAVLFSACGQQLPGSSGQTDQTGSTPLAGQEALAMAAKEDRVTAHHTYEGDAGVANPDAARESASRGLGSTANVNLSFAPQTGSGEPSSFLGGITVSAVGSATEFADKAQIVIVPERSYELSAMEQLTAEDRQDIVEKLAELEVNEADIDFQTRGRYGDAMISVSIDPDDIDDDAEAILDAVLDVIRRSEYHGLSFSLSDAICDNALSNARELAVSAAEKTADDLADALGVERGNVVGISEPPQPAIYLPYQLNPDAKICSTQDGGPYDNLLPFDAEPQVRVFVQIQITYLLNSATTESDNTPIPTVTPNPTG
jgi:uncharacterized protein YggE